jgi:hypothetical protein
MAFQNQPTHWLAALVPMTACAASALAAGEPRWIPGLPGVSEDDGIICMEVFDDGSGPALYVGGEFSSIGGVTAEGIARWNGSQWSSVGVGFDGSIGVWAMKVFDDGSGPALYVAGVGVEIGSSYWDLAKWNGTTWVGVAPLLSLDGPDEIRALETFDDGQGYGPALYAAGEGFEFGKCCKEPDLDAVAKWDGKAWQPLGEGLSYQDPWDTPIGTSLAVFDDGSGSSLYVGGHFALAGELNVGGIAGWNGRQWSATPGTYPFPITAMAPFDSDGVGPDRPVLLATGYSLSNHVAYAWDGSAWETFGPASARSNGVSVDVLTVGSTESVFVALETSCVRWDGNAWAFLADGKGWYGALASFDDGSTLGPALFVGGQFSVAGGYPAGGIARWGVPIQHACLADIAPPNGGDARINIADLLQVISGWGPCANPCIPDCLSDVNGDCSVNIVDLLAVIAHWGPCPGSIWE